MSVLWESVALLCVVAIICGLLGFWAGLGWDRHRSAPVFDDEPSHASSWDREVTAELGPVGRAREQLAREAAADPAPGWAPPGPAVTMAHSHGVTVPDRVTFWTPPSQSLLSLGDLPAPDPDPDPDPDPLALLDAPPDRLAAPAEIADAARYRLDWAELDRQQAEAHLWYDREFQTGQFKAAPKEIGEHQ